MTRVGIEVEGQTRSVLTTHVILILRTRGEDTVRVTFRVMTSPLPHLQPNQHGLESGRHGMCALRFPHTGDLHGPCCLG